MTQSDDTELLCHFLRTYCDVNGLGPDWRGHLGRTIRGLKRPERASRFKSQLAGAIVHGTLTVAEYERETRRDFDTEAELRDELCALWDAIYPGEEPRDHTW